MSSLISRYTYGRNGRTSIRLLPAFSEALDEICAEKKWTFNEAVAHASVDFPDDTLTSAVRLFILQHYRTRAAQNKETV